MSPEMKTYFEEIERKTDEIYELAKKARALGFDPELEPEITRAGDLAARVETLVGPQGVAEAIRKLEAEMQREEIALKIAEMIVDGKFGRADEKQTAEQAIRTALAILTEGIVVAPLEGITEVKIKKNFDGSSYLAIYYASPIRAAGGSAAALSVLAGDFVRRRLYLDPYKPIESEVERFVEEVELYRTTAREQYTPSADEVRLAFRNIPVEITGEATDKSIQVTAFRDLERVEHNFLRGGAILVLIEGVVQKAPKIRKYVEKLNIDGWGWLSELSAKASAEEAQVARKAEHKYLDDVIAGRPVFSHPGGGRGKAGGFRLRYGRARNTGIAAIGVHPATMAICDDFIAVGTQLKTERPGKGGAVAPVDSIEGPLVKLDDGSVVRVNTAEEARQLRDRVVEILFIGDILIGFGEFLENNHSLHPAGYCEEWWAQEVELALKDKSFSQSLKPYIVKPYPRPDPELAVKVSEELHVPLHPAYTYHYHDLNVGEIWELGSWLSSGEPEFRDGQLVALRLKLVPGPKRLLEELGVPHWVKGEQAVLENHAFPLCRCLGLIDGSTINKAKLQEVLQSSQTKEVTEIVETLAGFPVRKKAPTRIGARMGRPEKADPRKMEPPVHVLFPVGFKGGKQRNVEEAARGSVEVEVARFECPECHSVSFARKCQKCGAVAEYSKACPRCGQPVAAARCPKCNSETEHFTRREIDIKSHLDAALKRLGEEMPELVKGVEGMTSGYKIPEPLEKGILRAKHDVFVFKDGTVRFDATDVPLTHFIPREIGTPVERLHELGYTKDLAGQPLDDDDQVVELKVQDILLSDNAAEYLLDASKFVDDLLQKFYGIQPYYNASSREGLVGHMVLGLAPHTSVGTVARIIGFTSAKVGYAHPFFHAAKRRDCDGDEDCVMLLFDALLNFSKRFLPAGRGGQMDAPLILNMMINPKEIDKQAHHMDIMERYPLEFYHATLSYENPTKILQFMETVEQRLGTEAQYEGLKFSAGASEIAVGSLESRYKTLETMEEKLTAQLGLAEKIRAVDAQDVAELVIEHHFIPDLKGNTRKFGAQEFRCVKCNAHYRRVPLKGICTRLRGNSICGNNLLMTISRGGAEKYLMIAMKVADKYNVSEYTKQRLMLAQRDIKSIFESDAARQTSLADFL